MIILRGRRIFATDNGGGTPPVGGTNVVTVEVHFATVPQNPVVNFAQLKYNKKSGMIIVKDDGAVTDYTEAFAYVHGGMIASNGQVYPGIRYGDGCGNQVEPHYTFAINDAVVRPPLNPGTATWDQNKQMIAFGHGISNHSYQHGGYNKLYQVKQNEISIFNNSGGYRTRTFVIPTADEGYSTTAPYLGYRMVSSTFGDNSVADDDGNLVQYSSMIDANIITLDRLNRFLFSRGFAADWTPQDVAGLKDLTDRVLNGSKTTNRMVGQWFSHQLTNQANSLSSWIEVLTYLVNHPENGDTCWWPSMQEFVEYIETKFMVVKTQTLAGSVLKINLDLSNIPATSRTQDMSLLVSGGTISQVFIDGADQSSFNKQTGLINIFKQNNNVKNPSSDVLPPQIIAAVRVNNAVQLTYDRPVTQTVFSNTNGNAYTVSNNTITSVSGSGVIWNIVCQNQVAAGSTFDYRMQRGNAIDNSGMKVCTYIGYPVT